MPTPFDTEPHRQQALPPQTDPAKPVSQFLRALSLVLFVGGSAFGVVIYLQGHRGFGVALLLAAIVALIYLTRHPKTYAVPAATVILPPDKPSVTPAALIAAFPEPAIILDERLFVSVFNASAHTLFPLLQTGKPISFAVRTPEIINAIRQAVQGQPTQLDYAERVPQDKWMQVHAAPIHLLGKQGNPDHILLTLKDLTPMRRAERMRVDFVANASHEMRTPLASIIGFIETLQGAAKDDPNARSRFLDIMREQAKRMARLVDDLLSLSNIEQKEHLHPHDRTNLREVIAHVRDSLQPVALQKDVAVTLLMPDDPVIVSGDRDELIRLVENLTENAIKYGQSGKRVEIELIAANPPHTREIQLKIRDFGHGIPADHVPRLTERFYRVDESASRDKGGTGLGLAIVKHILNRHKGRLAIESKLGTGSTFTVFLPAVLEATAPSTPQPLASTGT